MQRVIGVREGIAHRCVEEPVMSGPPQGGQRRRASASTRAPSPP
jgi:hypothetical protein